MKNKILVLLFLIISTISFAQERVNALEFKKKYTIAQRDALSLGANDRVLIYVVDTSVGPEVNEVQIWDGTAWVSVSGDVTIPTLQQVTEAGATTDQDLSINADITLGNYNSLKISDGTYNSAIARPSSGFTSNRVFRIPDRDGTPTLAATDGTTTVNTGTDGILDLSTLDLGGEADTLQSVTERGATTTTNVSVQGELQVGDGDDAIIALISPSNGYINSSDGLNVGNLNVVNLEAPSATKNGKEITSFSDSWNASTNTPTLANTDTAKKAVEYKVSVAGTVDFGAGNITFNVGDIVANDGSIWYKKVDNNQGGTIPTNLQLGEEDTTNGSLTVHGNNTNTGGSITIENPADNDTEINNYSFETINGNGIFKANGGTNGTTTPIWSVSSDDLILELPRSTNAAIDAGSPDAAPTKRWVEYYVAANGGTMIPPTTRGKIYGWYPNIDFGTQYVGNGGWTQVGTGSQLSPNYSSSRVHETWHRRLLNATEIALYEDDVSIGAIGRGFYFICQVALPAHSSSSNIQFFGLYGSGSVIGNVNPSGLTNIIGVALDDTDSNYQFIYNDDTGTATKVDLGSNYDRTNVGANAASFQIELFCDVGSSELQYRIQDLNNVSSDTGWNTISSNLPNSTIGLYPQFYANIGTGASANNVMHLGLLEITRYQ